MHSILADSIIYSMNGIDLHMHSNFSDGELTPAALMQLAYDKQLHTVALTDHDTLDGNALAAKAAQDLGLRFIHGVEISSYWQYPVTQRAHSVHIVALHLQNFAPMQQLLTQQQAQRAQRAIDICAKLEQVLKTDFLPEVRALVDGVDARITRSHIAKVLVKNGVVTRMQQAFDRFLKEGKRAYVPFSGVEMSDAIKVIHASGGVAVLAHPTKYDLSATKVRALIDIFAHAKGDAIELPPMSQSCSTRQMIARLVTQYDLSVSIGSDFHGSHMPWLHLGHVPVLEQGQIGVWEKW